MNNSTKPTAEDFLRFIDWAESNAALHMRQCSEDPADGFFHVETQMCFDAWFAGYRAGRAGTPGTDFPESFYLEPGQAACGTESAKASSEKCPGRRDEVPRVSCDGGMPRYPATPEVDWTGGVSGRTPPPVPDITGPVYGMFGSGLPPEPDFTGPVGGVTGSGPGARLVESDFFAMERRVAEQFQGAERSREGGMFW
jgi:hypothetical protein